MRFQFYGDRPPKRFFQDRNLLLRNVILYPAHWLDERGVSLPSHRYKAIVLDVLQTIKRRSDTRGIQCLSGYLAPCVQTHFKHHGDECYEEAKARRSLTGDVIAAPAKLKANQPSLFGDDL